MKRSHKITIGAGVLGGVAAGAYRKRSYLRGLGRDLKAGSMQARDFYWNSRKLNKLGRLASLRVAAAEGKSMFRSARGLRKVAAKLA